MKYIKLYENFIDSSEECSDIECCSNCGESDCVCVDGRCSECDCETCVCCDEPGYEPEDCYRCSSEMEDNGLEYTQDFTWKDGTWVCDHCNTPQ